MILIKSLFSKLTHLYQEKRNLNIRKNIKYNKILFLLQTKLIKLNLAMKGLFQFTLI